MSLAEKKVLFTYDDLLNWEEDRYRHELIEGEHFMTPSPSYEHQSIAFRLAKLLDDYVQEKGLGEIFMGPVDVVFSDYDVLVPDIGFIPTARGEIIQDGVVKEAPDLVVEILSPSSIKRDREIKLERYAVYGVQEYWIVDPEKQTIDVFDLEEQGLIRTFGKHEVLNTPMFPEINLHLKKIF